MIFLGKSKARHLPGHPCGHLIFKVLWEVLIIEAIEDLGYQGKGVEDDLEINVRENLWDT